MRTIALMDRSFRIPQVVGAFAVPAALALIMPVYAMTLAPPGGGNVHLLRAVDVTARILALYEAGAFGWFVLRLRIGHDIAVHLAVTAFIVGVTVTLFSFGHRTAGEVMLVVGISGLAVSLPDDLRSTGIVLRLPTRGTLVYWILTIELPALLVLGLAARDYLQGNNTAADDFGTAWFFCLTYWFGYIGWSAVRAHSAVWALFSACFFAFWGFPTMMFLASLGPMSMIPMVAGFGGAVACLPYLWDSSQDGDAAVTPRRAAS